MTDIKVAGRGMSNVPLRGKTCFDHVQRICKERGYEVYSVPYAYDIATPLYDVMWAYKGNRQPSRARIMELQMFIAGAVEMWESL